MKSYRPLAASVRLLGASALASLSGFGAFQAAAQVASDSLLSRARISGTDSCAHLTVEFNTPVQYQSHFPETHGRQLRISVLPVLGGQVRLPGQQEEGLRPPDSDLIAVQNIRLDDASPSGARLAIDFGEDVFWSVEQGSNFSSIVIHLSASARGCANEEEGVETTPADARRRAEPVLSVMRTVPDQFDPAGAYAINLESQRGRTTFPRVGDNPVFEDYTAYSISETDNGKSWQRLRVGFFASRHDAEQALASLKPTYPDAWIVRTRSNERQSVYRAWLAARSLVAQPQTATNADPEAAAMLEEARAALEAGDNATAVRLTQAIVQRPESRVSAPAQELLGLARERADQLAHAKAEYEIYLEKYPDGEAAERVRQRLAVLVGGEEAMPQDLTGGGDGDRRSKVRTELSGSLSALYQRDESALRFEDTPQVGGSEVNPDPIEENRVNLNEVIYAADLTASVGNDRLEGLFRFSGVHRDDLRTDDPNDQSSISSLYFEFSDQQFGTTLRAGRQTRNTGGVFGRFDGVWAGFQATDWLQVNAVAGSPVQRSRDLFVESDRRFYGASVDLAMFDEKLETTVYYLDQTWGDLKDRQAAGFEFRYFDEKTSAYGVFDYDIHYGEMNLALLSGTRRFEDNSSINVALDYRRSPLLTTFNAVIGQGVEDPNELLDPFTDTGLSFTEEEVYDLAEARTAETTSAIVSYSRPLTENLQLNLDTTVTEVSETEETIVDPTDPFAPGNVPGFGATGPDVYYSAQLVGSNFYKRGTVAVAGVRYADLDFSQQYTLLLNARYPVTTRIRVNPKFRYDDRQRRDGSGEDRSARGSVRMTYDQNRTLHWEGELGGEWADGLDNFGSSRESEVFFNIGVRVDF